MPNRHSNSAVYNRLNYTSNPCEIICQKKVLPGEEKLDPLLYGVEIELSTQYSVPEMIDKQDELFFLCKSDGTVSGAYSGLYECVTVPMSLAAQKKHWAMWFDKVDYDKFDTSLDTSNGIHVHLSRNKFSEEHLRSFVWLFMNPMNKHFFASFSERKMDSINQFTRFVNPQGRNLYSTYKNIVSMTNSLGKYSVVNLSRDTTIEVRLFKGVVSFASLLKNLELLDAAYNFSLEFVDSPWSYVTLDNFLDYINKTPDNQYQCLKAYLKTMDIQRARSEAMIQNVILMQSQTKKKPSQLLEALNRNPYFVHSVGVVTQLNNLMSKPVFRWNKDKRIVEVIPVKRARIHSLDTVFAMKYTGKIKHKDLKEVISQPIDVPFSEDNILGYERDEGEVMF